MDVRHYPVIVERGENDAGEVGFGSFFPDLPGCVSGGDSLDEALLNAEKALAMHIGAMVKDGEDIPAPSLLSAIGHDREIDEVLRALVRVDVPAKWVTVNVSMAETLLQRIDVTAREIGMTRSGFLMEAARRMVEPI
ncbi:MAG: type II toxin-antitoxin system HicB family antitoxin [Magnetococcales bacterium]|nr:type II toxin-antitoxin system HicB family antitoxin [Magnetococcales bacterium]